MDCRIVVATLVEISQSFAARERPDGSRVRREQEVRKWRQGQEGFVSGEVTGRMRGGEELIALKMRVT